MVGIMNETKNYFSSRFTFVIEKLNIDVRMDSFMSNIMTVPKSAMVDIIRQLGELWFYKIIIKNFVYWIYYNNFLIFKLN